MRSSQAAFDLIVTEEDSDQAYYTKHYQHFEWPLGASGPTVGIGFDCGYETPVTIAQSWKDFVDAPTLLALQQAAGLTGETAHQFVLKYGNSITIPWDVALAQFKTVELPKYEAKVALLPNADQLAPDCFGALTSLCYNRGEGWNVPPQKDTHGRYVEMRAIKQHMTNKRFDLIPGDFLAMRRLWPQGGGLYHRREHEAALFRNGLGKPAVVAPPQSWFNKLVDKIVSPFNIG